MIPSYVAGTSDTPLFYKTIGQAFDDTVAAFPDREAIVARHQNVRLTYAQLSARVDRFAAGLVALGLNVGERIGIWSPNRLEWVIAQLATAKAGLILVNVNPAYRTSELEYALKKVGCSALILAERFKTSDYVAMMRAIKAPDLRLTIVMAAKAPDGWLTFADVDAADSAASRAELARRTPALQPDDPINIQFTSGTTGSPKGATLSHHNILNNGYFAGVRMRFSEKDRLCIPVPLYHCFGMVLGVLTCITHGACMVFPDEAYDPLSVLKAVQDERCTALHGVPTMFIAELDHPEFASFDMSSLRTGIMAGSPCPVEVMKRVIDRMNMREVTIGYGMTEVSPLSFQSMPDDSLDKRVGTVGRAHPFVESKIVDAEGRIVPRGSQGEILFRGYSVMRGYWNDPERTSEAIDQGKWMHSGDLGVMDAEGYVNITGRLKDMIIRGGENIYPREIEEFLYTCPGIQDVQVFGVPDDKYGEEVCAWIKLKDAGTTEESIRAFCKNQIAHYKIPRYIRFVAEYPMTVTGKIQKFVMRETMKAELGARDRKTA